MPIVTLTTDFGTRDWFVGVMKGVILAVNPAATLVDLTHEIPAGNIRAGAFALRAACRYFPPGTIHVAVVDPGVGSQRKAIAVKTQRYTFIGPDNGLLSWAMADETIMAVHGLENPDYFLDPISRTFHGRDVFAPVAGHLSRGLDIRKLGPALKQFTRLDWPAPKSYRGKVEGEVVYIDRFGNAITNIDSHALKSLGTGSIEFLCGHKRIGSLAEYYQAVPVGRALVVEGSSGFLEIAIHGGNAAQTLKLTEGTPILARCRKAR